MTEVVCTIANESMADAARDIKNKADNPDVLVDTGVSVDGTWQRRGFSSFNGNVAAISIDNGKVLDIESLSRHSIKCKSKEKLKISDRNSYDEWFATHNCKLNYKGSAGGMEVAGAKNIFGRSVEKYGLQYLKFLGDGDSKSYPAVKSIYPGVEVEKLECIGHVQKRVGTRLRNL